MWYRNMNLRLDEFRKNSSFSQDPAGLDADLTLPPTTHHLKVSSEDKDY
jgi:hypothetical protein